MPKPDAMRPRPRPKENCEAEVRHYDAEAEPKDVASLIKTPYKIPYINACALT